MAIVRITNKNSALECAEHQACELERLHEIFELCGVDISHDVAAIRNTIREIEQNGEVDEELALLWFGNGDKFVLFRNIIAAGTAGVPLFDSILNAKSYLREETRRRAEEERRVAEEHRVRLEASIVAEQKRIKKAQQLELAERLGISANVLRKLQGGLEEDDRVDHEI